MPKPPPRLSSARSSPVAWCTWPSRPTTRCAAASNPAVSKICEPMWLCRPVSCSAGSPDHPHGRGQRVAGGQREAELLVLVGGRDELVGVRLDADGRPDEHRHRRAARRHPRGGQRGQPLDLVEGVEHEWPIPARRQPQLDQRLVVAVQRDPLGGEAGAPGRGRARCRCRRPGAGRRRRSSGHLAAEERFGRVVHVGVLERGGEVGGRAAEVALVEHEQRGAVLAGELGDRPPAEVQLAVDPLRRARPHVRVERARAPPAGHRRPYGWGCFRAAAPAGCALTSAPVRSRRARRGRCAAPWAVAAHSHSRAVVSAVASSSPRGRTRQES